MIVSRTPLLISLLLTAAVTALVALPAQAHTQIVASTPEADETVTEPPVEVVIEFGEELDPAGTVDVRVIDPAGDDLVAAPPTVEGAVVTVPLNLAVAEGEHTVDVAFTAADGDDQVESFSFTYAPPAAIATPTATVSDAPVQPAPTTPAPTATPTPTPTPTPTEVLETETVEATEGEEALVSADDGGGGVLPVVLVVAGAVAAGAILLVRLRSPGFDGGVADPDQDR